MEQGTKGIVGWCGDLENCIWKSFLFMWGQVCSPEWKQLIKGTRKQWAAEGMVVILFALRSILHSVPPFSVAWKVDLSGIHHLGSFALWLPCGSATGRQQWETGEQKGSLILPTWPCYWLWSCSPITTAPPEQFLSPSSSSQPTFSYTVLPMPTLSGLVVALVFLSFLAGPVISLLVPQYSLILLWP